MYIDKKNDIRRPYFALRITYGNGSGIMESIHKQTMKKAIKVQSVSFPDKHSYYAHWYFAKVLGKPKGDLTPLEYQRYRKFLATIYNK